MYKLVIAEKPSVAKSIAAVLGARKHEDGFIVIRKPPARLGSSGKAMPMGLEKKNSF